MTTTFTVLETGEIELDRITVSEDNSRKTFEEDALQELADNIKRVGILEPILLRKNRAHLILVAGERRVRAAKLAGLTKVPYRLLDITAEQAQEVMIFENLHRKDLNALEEAKAFEALLKGGGYTVQDVADRVDKSKAYVYRSLRLLDLPEEAQEALKSGKITIGHARHLLRIPVKEVSKLLKEIQKYDYSAQTLRNIVDNTIGCALDGVKFPLNEEFAGEIACSKCPFNVANQQSLFDENLSEGRCTNRKCCIKKEETYNQQFIESVKEKAAKQNMGFLEPQNIYGYYDTYDLEKGDGGYDSLYILHEELAEQLAAELKKHPEKFALTVNLNNLEEVTVVTDKKLNEKIEKQRQHDQDDEDYNEEDEREERLAVEKEKALCKMLAGKLADLTIKAEKFNFNFFRSEYTPWQKEILTSHLGLKEFSYDEILKLPTAQALRVLFILDELTQWDMSEDLANLLEIEITEEMVEQAQKSALEIVGKTDEK